MDSTSISSKIIKLKNKKSDNISDIISNTFKPSFAQCKECVYWERIPDKKTSTMYGECRIVPPALTPDSKYGIWPLTFSDHWCGEGITAKDYLDIKGKEIEFEPCDKE